MSELKKVAAKEAIKLVKPHMKLGLGTGSTANEFIKLLAQEIKNGLVVRAVATSVQTENLCKELEISLDDINDLKELDLVIDGADEISRDLIAIKGGGGALLREKIVALSSKYMVVIADQSKLVDKLGNFSLPIEITKFGKDTTRFMIKKIYQKLGYKDIKLTYRLNSKNELYITDNGNYIIDASAGTLTDPRALSKELLNIAGVVDHGLFIDIVSKAIIAMNDGKVNCYSVSY